MEAMTAIMGAVLTVYSMLKTVDKGGDWGSATGGKEGEE